MDFVAGLENLVAKHGFDHFGWARLERPLSMDFYRQWIADGHHGSMNYLAEHAEIKAEPQRLSPRARSAISIAKPYFPHPYPDPRPLALRTALYAQGADYHRHFKNELENLADRLRSEYPAEEFLCFTDSGPILERDLAYRAGLGWVGKNTCLIDPQRGSLFFIGQILTSLDLEAKTPPMRDFCGTCDRCIRACPTGAIEAPRKLNATKCIAYWTIESKEIAPASLREKFGDWFFGCDICQTVCPWNEKAHGRDVLRSLNPGAGDPSADLRWILESSNHVLAKAFRDSPVSRARPRLLKRNALQVIANMRLRELRPQVERYLDHPELAEIARSTLTRLTLA